MPKIAPLKKEYLNLKHLEAYDRNPALYVLKGFPA